MTDPPSYPDSEPDTGDDTGAGPDPGSPPGMPRWVKVSGIVVGVLVLFAFGISLIAGADHGPEQFGPGRHAPGGDQ